MSETFEGGCQCGAVRYRVVGEARALFVCHCKECQRQSSSAFGMALWVAHERVELVRGALQRWIRHTPSGREMECQFCGTCGSRLFHRMSSSPEIVSIKPGTLDDSRGLAPVAHIWTERSQPWLPPAEGCLLYPQNPGDFAEVFAAWRARPRGVHVLGARLDEHAQWVGPALPGFVPPAEPARTGLAGRYARLVPLSAAEHAAPLAHALADEPARFTYLAYGPFTDVPSTARWMDEASASRDPLFFAVLDGASLEPGGIASFLRIEPAHGSIELGHLLFAPRLARTRTATDALYTMIAWAFEAGYRRVEWKCDALNAPSRRAAQRLGFTYEGTFRNHLLTRGRSRDTAWYALVDRDWPALRARFDAWLAPGNFDAQGRQRSPLGERR